MRLGYRAPLCSQGGGHCLQGGDGNPDLTPGSWQAHPVLLGGRDLTLSWAWRPLGWALAAARPWPLPGAPLQVVALVALCLSTCDTPRVRTAHLHACWLSWALMLAVSGA